MKIDNFPILGEGGCHIVYDTQDGNVLKQPKWIWRILCSYDMVAEDIRLAKKYFETYLWTMNVERDPKGYKIIQPILPVHKSLTSDMLDESIELREQFDDFLKRNESLYRKEGRAFDFFGLEGMVMALIANEEIEGEEGISHMLRKVFGQLVAKVFLGKDEVGAGIPIANLLVIERDGKKVIQIADPTLTNELSVQAEDRIFAYCCNSLNRRYMKKYFGREILV